ncbi:MULTISPECIES: peptide deformylase [Rhodobacterales]|jgi:peptide deformylase|uniref:peptide deformylase n=1 Tax=Rhodobacterales TaxID=204455 RepID=UPI00237F4A7C|nr:peptide deformylase [Phaeobacter gallaeciensis]MDE4141731.1 peptide deformylase [Phaeobacter gallaeciensis]MDE4150321.1 peptide deformylase [Phaeobacter gallaeciensis]MDE4154402.1 peptide deformylase [Phaeobacter gallaeciensis]MDE4229938.1 peptide deformylase [Phaeobacter gallaeciensis]MDE4258868.1 peptide deformylase [Phaeobacter gallaeciensis]
MAVLPILKWPDPRLSQHCAPVEQEHLDELIADMFDTMYAANGRGLAAPQVGVLKRLFVMDCTWKEGKRSPMVMINPSIMAVERVPVTMEEGCLSIPGVMVPVERPVAVTVQWTAAEGDIHMADFDGFEARCIQHEFDHLNGTVTFDHLDPEARSAVEVEYTALKGTSE